MLLLHGLEGSASSRYVLGNATRAWAAGCNVVRMNMRSCGGSDALAPTIYHSGRSEDVAAVVNALVREHGLERIALVGYSMGANLVLNYAGGTPARQVTAGSRRLAADGSRGFVSSAARAGQPRVRVALSLRAMKRRLRAKAALFPALYGSLEGEGVYERIRTMRDFDQEIVARYGGFRDADDYYTSVASSRVAVALAVPTLILHSLDDPFIRMLDSTRSALVHNPSVTYVETNRGGHCAFLAESHGGEDIHWAERTLLGYLLAHERR